MSLIQLVEIKVKDTEHWKAAGRDEVNSSNLAIARLLIIPETTSSVKESDEFVNLKRKNAESKDYVDGCWHVNATLGCNLKKMTVASLIDEEEVKF